MKPLRFLILILLLILISPARAATVTGLVYNAASQPIPAVIRFTPQSTPYADSQTIIGGTIPWRADTSGVFSLTLRTGRYAVHFPQASELIHILVPNDDNTYNLNDLSVDIPSTLGKISSRVLPGQGVTFETNAPGTFAEQITLHATGTNLGQLTVTNGFRLTNGTIKQLTVVGASSFIQPLYEYDASFARGFLQQQADGLSQVTYNGWGLTNLNVPATQAEVYDTPGTNTWTKPAGAKMVHVFGTGGGGAGGSGARGAALTVRRGGGSGGAAAAGWAYVLPDSITGPASVVVGAGGIGGAAVITDDTIGNKGNDGAPSSFGDLAIFPPGGGQLDNYFDAGGFYDAGGDIFPGPLGKSSVSFGGSGTAGNNANSVVGSSGGSGGGLNSADDEGNGGAGGGFANTRPAVAGSLGGTAPGGNGAPGHTFPNNELRAGLGGGGGASSGGNGGNGGRGAGGGGGGGSTNGTNSGAGGNGGAGLVVVVTFF